MEQKKQTKQANEPSNIYLNKTNNHYGSTHRNNREARTILLKDVIFAQTLRASIQSCRDATERRPQKP